MTLFANLPQITQRDREQLSNRLRKFTESWECPAFEILPIYLEDFLPPNSDPSRRLVLQELILSDLTNRWDRGQPILLEKYLEMLPELGGSTGICAQLVFEEFRLRRQHGQEASLPEYRARFPDHFEDLLRLSNDTGRATETEGGSLLPPPVSHPQNDMVGDYKLLGRIGSGTYGSVYRAEAPGGVPVALKIVRPDRRMTDTEYSSLEVIKRLRHTYLIQLQSFWWEDDQLIMVMDLADRTLEERHKECRANGLDGVPAEELVRYIRETAEAVDYLHEEKRIHRDIKPANILLLKDHVKLGDCGLAKLFEPDQKDMTATLGGTPMYMAPEVWDNRVSPKSDQYSLAATYVELRSSAPLYSARSHLHLMQLKQTAEPDLEGLPEPERQVVRKALAKKPEDRYASCGQFAKALEEAIRAGGEVRPRTAAPQRSRRYRLYGSLATVLAVTLVGLWIGFLPSGRSLRTKLQELVTSRGDDPLPAIAPAVDPATSSEQKERKIEAAKRAFDAGSYEVAFEQVRSLNPHFAQDAEKQRREMLERLLLHVRGKLDPPSSPSAYEDAYQAEKLLVVIQKEMQQVPPITDPQLRLSIPLHRARIATRNENWNEVDSQLNAIAKETPEANLLDDESRWLYSTVRVLAKIKKDSDKFYAEETLSDLVDLTASTPPTPLWETNELQKAKVNALVSLLQQKLPSVQKKLPSVQKKLPSELTDARLPSVFGEDIWCAYEALKDTREALRQLPASPIPTDTLERVQESLANAHARTKSVPMLNDRVKFAQDVISMLKNGSMSHYDEFVIQTASDEYQFELLLKVLLYQMEQQLRASATVGDRDDDVRKLIGRSKSVSSMVDLAKYSSALSALEMVKLVQNPQVIPPYPDISAFERQLRKDLQGEALFSPWTTAFLNAARAEALAQLGERGELEADQSEWLTAALSKLEAQMAEFGTTSFGRYAPYVISRIYAVNGRTGARPEQFKKAIDSLRPLLKSDAMPPIMERGGRGRDFAAQLLRDATDALPVGNPLDLENDYYTKTAADLGCNWLQLANQQLGDSSDEVRKRLILTHFFASSPDLKRVQELSLNLELSPLNKADGQLFRACALASIAPAAKNRDAALIRFAGLFEWYRKHGSTTSDSAFYKRYVKPALAVAEEIDNGVQKEKDLDAPINVAAIPAQHRANLATIYAMSAGLVERDFVTRKELFDDDDAAAIKHQYRYYRLAAELAPRVDYLRGQYFALEGMLSDVDRKVQVEKMHQLADRVRRLNPADPIGSGMLGQYKVVSSRMTLDRKRRAELLKDAVDDFSKSLEMKESATHGQYRLWRSTARVELSFVRTAKDERRKLLLDAIDDAEAAIAAKYHPIECAHLALGNAQEDLAYYCSDGTEWFDKAIGNFDEANKCLIKHVATAATLAAGRCRFRKVIHASERQLEVVFNASPADLKELTKAAKDFEEVAGNAEGEKAVRAESCYFLGRTQFQMRTKDWESAFEQAVSLADSVHWPLYQCAWAKHVYLEANRSTKNGSKNTTATDPMYAKARSLAEKVLAKRREGVAVDGQHIDDALKTMFMATIPQNRQALVDLYGASDLPVEHRVRLKLLFADQRTGSMDQGDQLLIQYRSQFPKSLSEQLPAFERYAEQAVTEASKNECSEELRVRALSSLAECTYARWFGILKQEKRSDPSLRAAAGPRLKTAIDAIAQFEKENPPMIMPSRVFVCWGVIQGSLALEKNATNKTTILKNAIELLNARQSKCVDASERQLIQVNLQELSRHLNQAGPASKSA